MSSPRNSRSINMARIAVLMSDLAPNLHLMRMFGDQVVSNANRNAPHTYNIHRVGDGHHIDGNINLVHGLLPFSYKVHPAQSLHQFVYDMTLNLIQRERIMARAVNAHNAA